MAEYLIVLNVIAISVALSFWLNTESDDNNDISNQKNIASTKKCPCCSEEIKADAMKCRNCGSLLDVFKSNGS